MMAREKMTIDKALARIMEAGRIADEAERRSEIRKVLQNMDQDSWSRGSDDQRFEDSWGEV
jgi:hypothetical protein